MSLFGGEQADQRLASPLSVDEESLYEPSPSPDSAQAPSLLVPEVDDPNDAALRSSPPNAENNPVHVPTIKPTSWRRWTAPDRELAASLEDIESADLAAHLYNTHRMKHRLRLSAEHVNGLKSWQSKDAWLKKGRELQYQDPLTQELETELIPSKLWSAWPLPPYRFRGNEFPVGDTEDEDGWHVNGWVHRDSGETMREELLALFLRIAKEDRDAHGTDEAGVSAQMLKAETGDRSSSLPPDFDVDMAEDILDADADGDGASERSSGAKLFNTNVYSSETEGEQLAREINDLEVDTDAEGIPIAADNSDLESGTEGQRAASRDKPPAVETTIFADDDLARRVLDPSISSLLSSVDKLVVAIHRCRTNHFGDRGRSRSASVSDYLADRGPTTQRSRSLSRSRSRGRTAKPNGPSLTATGSSKTYPKQRFEPSTLQQGSDFAAQMDLDERPRRRQTRSTSSASSNMSGDSQAGRGSGLMDWSEVLGLAAVSGWNQRAIARAAQRCASLFDETMGFRTFDENLAAETIPETIQYTPSPIMTVAVSLGGAVGLKRPYFTPGSLQCPHSGCPGSLREYSSSNRLTEHIRRKHGYDPRTNDSDNEERTVAGVHIDGYLRPVWAKPGWIGHGRAKSEVIDQVHKAPRRKRQKLESRPTSTLTSAYHTHDEGEETETPRLATATQVTETLKGVSQRLKPYQACTNCRRRKKPCDGRRPCGRCEKMGDEDSCLHAASTTSSRSCSNCKRSRKKCDAHQPCGRCEQRGEGDSCEYPII